MSRNPDILHWLSGYERCPWPRDCPYTPWQCAAGKAPPKWTNSVIDNTERVRKTFRDLEYMLHPRIVLVHDMGFEAAA
jgi:hypothetical protein